MPVVKMHKDDFPLIRELAETMKIKDIADKWEVMSETITRFLLENGTSRSEIVDAFRLRVITQGHYCKESLDVTAEKLNITKNHLYMERKRLMPSIVFAA